MYKKLFLLFACILSVGFGFSWNNSQFLDSDFWDSNPSKQQIFAQLYQNSTYTDNWEGYNNCKIDYSDIIEISEFPDVLAGNMIYILNTGNISVTKTITVGDCTAIISKSGTLIDNNNFNGDIFVINGKYSILDNISISGEKKRTQQYGIRINNTTGITLNNINIQGLHGGIYSNKSNYNKYNNIKVSNVYAHPFILENSNNNYVSNIECSYSENEAGIQITNGSNNYLNNLKLHDNGFQGLLIYPGNNNKIYNIIANNNKDTGIRIRSSSGNYFYSGNIYNNINLGVFLEYSYNNELNYLDIQNNTVDGVYLSQSSDNIFSGLSVFNNNVNGIELEKSQSNTFSNIKNYNNGIRDKNGNAGCSINLTGSNDNIFRNTTILNNRIGICLDGRNIATKNNTFENMKIFNNYTLDSKTGDYEEPTYNGIIYGNINGNVNTNLKRQVTEHTQITGDSGLRVSFNDMINPQNENGKFLFSWTDGYEAIMGYQSGFSGAVVAYSMGIHLVGNSGYILSNGTYAIPYQDGGVIKSYFIGNTGCGADRCLVNIPITPTAAAIKINGEDIHAEVFFDTTAPTCQTVQYNITGNTAQDVVATLTDCDEQVTGTISHTFTENGTFVFEYEDLIGNKSTGYAEVTRINKPKPSTGGGGGSSSSKTTNQDTHQSAETKKSEFKFDKENFDPKYSDESNMAYQRAYANNITTKTSIEESMMDESLDRIAMAKMLSQYAINILGKHPNTSQVNNFNDVSFGLDNDYNNGVTQSYQLGIMGQHIADNNFRPYDDVTRGEFTTALSRMLYDLEDGKDIFYSTHIKKLYDEGIITNNNPELKEVRGYVMIMLMRSDLGMTGTKNESIKNEEQHTSAKDIQNTEPYFTEPYKRLQIYRKIGDLQELLTYLGFFDGKINSVYNLGTIDAITDFQISKGLIDKDDLNNPARGYLGPATRAALDKERYKYQENK